MKEKFDSSYYKRIIRFLKDKLKDFKNEIESLQSYIEKVGSSTKSNIEMIDVLKARLKVHEIQLVVYKFCEEEAV
jgi:peptidoglycan hydrolase CwlO-like protein